MVPLTIFVDMDDVLENLTDAWCRILDERYETGITSADLKHWDMTDNFPGLLPTQIFGVLEEPSFWDTVEPLPDAVEKMERLILSGHRVYVATASTLFTIQHKIERVLFRYFTFLTWENVIIVQDKSLLNGDVLIDDAPHNLVNGSFAKILFTRPHNASVDAFEAGFLRANNWKEVYDLICTYASENFMQYGANRKEAYEKILKSTCRNGSNSTLDSSFKTIMEV